MVRTLFCMSSQVEVYFELQHNAKVFQLVACSLQFTVFLISIVYMLIMVARQNLFSMM